MLYTILLIITGTLTSLLAGIFLAFSVSVNGALAKLRDDEYIRAMQAINRVILNGIFLIVFMGPVLLLPVVTFMAFSQDYISFALLLVASVLYIAGTFGLTAAKNVPLNDYLDKIKVETDDLAEARRKFVGPWGMFHAIRTVAAVIATILVFVACVL